MSTEATDVISPAECFELETSAGSSPTSTRENLLRLESEMLKREQVEIPVKHIFTKGIYAREILIPKGTLLIGKIHKHAHLNIISQGDISVLTEHGVKRLTAPCAIVSSPGIKRAGYAHEDTVWTTIHATEETDLDKLEAELIVPSYAALDDELKVLGDLLCLG